MDYRKYLPGTRCLLAVLVSICLMQFLLLLSHDISSQSLYPTPAQKPAVYLMSYADGDEIYFRNQNALMESAINKGIDFVFNYRREHLDPDFVQKYADVLQHKIGAGYWLWKPWLILQTLNQMPADAILIYSDTNYVFVRPITDLLSAMQKHDILIVSHPNLTREQESQRTTLDGMGCTSTECRQGLNSLSGFLMLRNNAMTKAFIQEWLDACQVKEFLVDTHGALPEYPSLVKHKQDQAILGILAHKHRDQIKMLSYQFIRDHYIRNTYRKVGTDYLTKDADIFKYSMLGRIQYNWSNSYPLVQLRKFILTHLPNFPWRSTYYQSLDLEQHLMSPE